MSHRDVTIAPACAGKRHNLSRATNAELALGRLRCGCLVDGKAAARLIAARKLAESK